MRVFTNSQNRLQTHRQTVANRFFSLEPVCRQVANRKTRLNCQKRAVIMSSICEKVQKSALFAGLPVCHGLPLDWQTEFGLLVRLYGLLPTLKVANRYNRKARQNRYAEKEERVRK